MLSVLIVDDERAICFLLRKLIHWEELGLTCLGTASSGAEAYRLAREQKPDILITDIQMPGMNGLELIEKVQKEQPDTSFVIVSGYQEFEYAKQAIRFGVEDYLLKPIKENELNAILSRICKKKQESSEVAVLREEKEKVRKRWMQQLIEGKTKEGDVPDTLFYRKKGCFYLLQAMAWERRELLDRWSRSAGVLPVHPQKHEGTVPT